MALEDSSKQGRMIEEIDQDVGVTLVTPTKQLVSEDQPKDKLGSSWSAAYVTCNGSSSLHSYSRRDELFVLAQKLKQRQEKVGYEATIRLQEQLNEEESQRIARDGFAKNEYEDIRARVEADEELTQKLQVEEMDKYSEVDQA
ncbi:hypothetical protein Tco_0888912 [Tanacetum coccineum]